MIYISSGHHEKAQGAKFNDVTEYHFTTEWADLLSKLIDCVRVPNGTLSNKVAFINDSAEKGDIAIEIHFNSAKMWKDQNANGVIDDGEMVNVGRGSETLYYPGSKTGQSLAEKVQQSLSKVLPPNRGAKKGYYQMNPEKGADYFLERTKCTAIIIEPEFIDNLDKIMDNKETAYEAIAQALKEK